ncbi:MAG: hypothetical protein Q9165_002498 [Trypethelium subeluteriae]
MNPYEPTHLCADYLQVSLKDGANTAELDKAKQTVEQQGGKITHEFKLIKGFTYAIPVFMSA